MSPLPRSIIFDLDGTLIDSRSVILECFDCAANAVFPGVSYDRQAVRLGPPLRKMFQITFPSATDADIDNLLKNFRRQYDQDAPAKTPAYDRTADLLAHCKSCGIRLDVATNKPSGIAMRILAHLKLDGFFHSIIGLDSVQPPFPSKGEMVRHILRSGALKAAETWYVGDSAEDAAAAAQSGLPFVWASYGYGHIGKAERGAIFRSIQSVAELQQMLA